MKNNFVTFFYFETVKIVRFGYSCFWKMFQKCFKEKICTELCIVESSRTVENEQKYNNSFYSCDL